MRARRSNCDSGSLMETDDDEERTGGCAALFIHMKKIEIVVYVFAVRSSLSSSSKWVSFQSSTNVVSPYLDKLAVGDQWISD